MEAASRFKPEIDKVIFDEVHYINNNDRGIVWEECMILLPKRITMIMLSATIDKPEDFASWLGDLKQKPINLKLNLLIDKSHPWMKVSSIDVIHKWRNVMHGWNCHPQMPSMDGEPSSMDDIHR